MLMQKYLLSLFSLLFLVGVSKAQVNLSSGLVAYYPFNGTFNDASGNGNNGVAMNGATFGTDQWGNANSAASFDGIDDWVNVANPSFKFSHTFSFSFRFKTNSTIHQVMMTEADYTTAQNMNFQIAFNHPTYGGGLYLGTNHNGTCTTPGGVFNDYAIPTTPIAANQWYCAVMTFNNGIKRIFINGVLVLQHTVTSGTYPTMTDSCAGTTPFRMGTWWQSDPRYYNGLMDEVRLYNRVLNQQEIDSFCNLVTPPNITVLNKYAAVQSRGTCDNSFVVDTATGFNVGDTVLMIQMKGAVIDTTNTASFGTLQNVQGAGNYELNVISAKTGNTLNLKYKLQHTYNIPDGLVQFVRIPRYQKYTVSQLHTCLPWTGTKGGVFAVQTVDSLILNNNIDVSGKGFAGAQNVLITHNNFILHQQGYHYPVDLYNNAPKGEGAAVIPANISYGRGPLYNGGGGGNSTNSGGGGGGNGGSGGQGGNEYQFTNPSYTIGGIGGRAIAYTTANNRLFLGGGGGAGHANDSNPAYGGNGGGLVFILSGKLAGNSDSILANGANGLDCTAGNGGCIDGFGGGGAGGTVYINSGTVSALVIKAKGGNGANVNASGQNTYYGPGGGGGGGTLLLSSAAFTSSITSTMTGGANGVCTVTNGSSAWGAQSGNPGTTLTGFSFAYPTDTFRVNNIAVNFTDSVVSCVIRKLINTTTTTTSGAASYSWDAGVAGTSTQRSPTFTFPGNGTYPVKLIVVDSNGCRDSITRNIIIDGGRFANAGADVQGCIGGKVTLHASGGITYSWSPTTGLSNPNAATTIDTVSVVDTFVVTVTNTVGCIDRDTVHILLVPGLPISASPADTSICKSGHAQLRASGGVSYVWSPALGLSNPLIADPEASPAITTRYYVTGTDTAGCKNKDSITVNILPGPDLTITTSGEAVSCYQRSVTLYGHGAASYVWHPGFYCNDSTLASPAVTPPRTTLFTVVGTDRQGCTSEDTINVIAAVDAVVFMPNAFTPNGDGNNDKIYPIIYCDFNFEGFYVYNRWGQQVFYTPTYRSPWDGTFNGTPCELGVYFYFVKGHKDNGEKVIVKGNITLIR